MLDVWLYSIISVIIVSLISMIGVIALAIRGINLRRTLLFLVGFSAGGLFGGALIHLLPEAVEKYGFGLNISIKQDNKR